MKYINDNEERFQMFTKINGRYIFMGWYKMLNEEFCISTKKRNIRGKKYIYKTYKWLNGDIEQVAYII